ncbi:Hypothetical predicted protein, partial [Pelobates cultripes]
NNKKTKKLLRSMFTFLLLLCLVGSIYTQESGDNVQEDYDIQNNIEPFPLSDATSEDHLEDSLTSDKNTIGDKCTSYKFYNHHLTFSAAQGICKRYGGNLCSIHSARTNRCVSNLVRRANRSVTLVWIGVRNYGGNSPFRNVDGTRLDYTNWGCGLSSSISRCAALNIHTGRWHTFHCGIRLPFVCNY